MCAGYVGLPWLGRYVCRVRGITMARKVRVQGTWDYHG